MSTQQELIEKIKTLPPEQVSEVSSFVERLARRERVRRMSQELYEQVSVFAENHNGTELVLDSALEAAGIESLLKATKNDKW